MSHRTSGSPCAEEYVQAQARAKRVYPRGHASCFIFYTVGFHSPGVGELWGFSSIACFFLFSEKGTLCGKCMGGIEEHGLGISLRGLSSDPVPWGRRDVCTTARPSGSRRWKAYRCEVQVRVRAFYLAEINWLAAVAGGEEGGRGKGSVFAPVDWPFPSPTLGRLTPRINPKVFVKFMRVSSNVPCLPGVDRAGSTSQNRPVCFSMR